MKVGEKIRYLRELNGLTQEDVAKKLHTTPQNIYKYEKGIIQNIPTANIVTMAEMFSVSPSELVGWAEDISGLSSEGYTAKVTPEKIELGNKLRLRREAAGLTVEELALKLHILSIIIENYESGQFDHIDSSRLKKIAELTDTPVEYFTNKSETINSQTMNLTETEKILISKYRSKPEYRTAIHQLLDIPDEYTYVYPVLSPSDFDNRNVNSKVAQTKMVTYDISPKKKDSDN